MSMRRGLSLRIEAAALMLDDNAGRSQAAIRLNRQRRDVAAAVIGHQDTLTGLVHGQVARARALRRLLIKQG